ncbi:MAG: hypothetical protein GF421_00835 [Candidatus Aminicenantes bacterium]|nr:hypothetical protein [Candidatus Aminicenantes bacterium]
MSKKTLFKAVSLVVVFSLLALALPNTAQAKQNNAKFTFAQIINQPAQFIVSLFPFLQNNSQQRTDRQDSSDQNTDQTVQKTGELDIDRPSRDG